MITRRGALCFFIVGTMTTSFPAISTGFVLPARTTRPTLSFSPPRPKTKNENILSRPMGRNKGKVLWDTSMNGDDGTVNRYDNDWRAFRAQLVLNEKNILKEEGGKKSKSIFPETAFLTEISSMLEGEKEQQQEDSPKNNDASVSTWIHEQTVLEVGSVLIHTPRTQDVCGLARQSLYHAVILIVETNAEQTMGILLNRPTDYCLMENDEDVVATSNVASFETAGIYFGGDESSLHTMEPKYYVLHHPIKTLKATMNDHSEILPGLSLMNVEEAKRKLFDNNYRIRSISTGEEGEDALEYYKEFTTYSGHILWDTLELEAELEHDIWASLSIDSLTLRNALQMQKQQENSDEGSDDGNDMLRNYLLSQAGLDHRISNSINTHNGSKIKKYNHHVHNFDRRMFEEWRRTHLKWEGDSNGDDHEHTGSTNLNLQPGDLLRSTDTSSTNEFLFHDQEFQKSLVLILQDDEDLTVGVLLSHPTTKSCEIHQQKQQQFWFPSLSSSPEKAISLPVRYGGNFLHFQDEEKNEEQMEIPPFCLHYLGSTVGGEPIGNISGNYHSNSIFPIHKASIEQASEAISMGIASPSDFIIVQGMTVWPKDSSGGSGSRCLASSGCFERVPHQQIPKIWDILHAQKPLSPSNMEFNIDVARQAWNIANAVDNSNNRDPTFPIIKTSSAISSSRNLNNDGSSSSSDNIEKYQRQKASSEKKQSTVAAKADNRQIIIHNDLGFDAVKTWLTVYLLQDDIE